MKAQARSLPVSHPTIARQPLGDVSSVEETDATAGSIKALFPDVFDAVIREIRTRNYSIRTEQSYVAWLSRFIRFHNQQHPKKLDAKDIANYLTHLAVSRMGASSTQRQALNAIIFYYKNILNKSFDDLHTRFKQTRHFC